MHIYRCIDIDVCIQIYMPQIYVQMYMHIYTSQFKENSQKEIRQSLGVETLPIKSLAFVQVHRYIWQFMLILNIGICTCV
jgi:hypothetical protein